MNPLPEIYDNEGRHSGAASSSTSRAQDFGTDNDEVRQAMQISRAEEDLNDASLQSLLAQTQQEAEDRELQEALRLSALVSNYF